MPRRRPDLSPRGFKILASRHSSTPDPISIKYESDYTSPNTLTLSPHLIDHGYGATPQNQIVAGHPTQAPAVKRKLNLEQHSVVVPFKQEQVFKTPEPKRGAVVGQSKAKKGRYNTSLSVLTQKFSALLENSPNGVVDLNIASKQLNVQKRRIYDITNVLEGIGIVEKKAKNNIQWKGGSRGGNTRFSRLHNDLKTLENQENSLDALIREAESELRNLTNDKYGYVTYHDLRSIARFKNKTVMAIKAPPNTPLTVPDPEDRQYYIMMKSDSHEIEVFLCPDTASPPRPKPEVPPMEPLLRDITISPGFFLTTPPVPLLDSPIVNHKPISAGICRSLSFKDALEDDKDEVRKCIQFHENNTRNTNGQCSQPSTSSTNLSTNLSPMNMSLAMTFSMGGCNVGDNSSSSTSSGGNGTPLLYDNVDLGPMVSRYGGHQGDSTNSGGDPLFSAEPFVSLEPFVQPEYNFSLDTNEGLADLFDYF